MKSLLVEIGSEEIPARMVAGAVDQLENKISDWIVQNKIDTDFPGGEGELEITATPRRLVVEGSLPGKEADKTAELKGPPAHVAYDDDREPTGALEGFCRQNELAVSDVEISEIDGGQYVTAEKIIEGRPLVEAIRQDWPEIILSLRWPKQMRWEESKTRFIRPIRWLLALADGEPFDLRVGPVSSAGQSRGLRFGENERFKVHSIENYRKKIEEDKIILNLEDRKNQIKQRAESEAESLSGRIIFPPGLLMEVTNLVEAPVVFSGEFSEDFLKLPDPVLIETMVAHQKYFPVANSEDGSLLPCFIGVRNGGGTEGLETVKKGNERVIRARLNDAVFFYNKDLKREFESYRRELQGVIFQEKLGSLYDKTERLAGLAKKITAIPDSLAEIARHCKNDQVTEIVAEFPSLQGTMGKIYARQSGWSEEEARVIEEHYHPQDRDDELPSSPAGCWLSLLDRIDTLVGFFNLGSRPTGSADPYGLRRDALSLLRIILGAEFEVDLEKLLRQAAGCYETMQIEVSDEVLEDLHNFLIDRFYHWFRREEEWSENQVRAVLDKFWNRPLKMRTRLKWLAGWQNSDRFNDIIEAARRIYNIAGESGEDKIKPDLFENDIEQEILEICRDTEENINGALAEDDPGRVFLELENLSDVVHRYFEKVMVMAEDSRIKKNRLATLNRIHSVYDSIADFSSF